MPEEESERKEIDSKLFLFRRGLWEPQGPTEDSGSISSGEKTLRVTQSDALT